MTSKAEQITAAVYTALTSPAMTSVPVARVFRDLHGALQSDLLPAIAVESGDEPEPGHRSNGFKTREIEVRVIVFAMRSSSQGAYAAADPGVVEAHARVMADRTLGGLAIGVQEGPTRRDRQDGETQKGAVTKTYRIQFYTTEASLE